MLFRHICAFWVGSAFEVPSFDFYFSIHSTEPSYLFKQSLLTLVLKAVCKYSGLFVGQKSCTGYTCYLHEQSFPPAVSCIMELH